MNNHEKFDFESHVENLTDTDTVKEPVIFDLQLASDQAGVTKLLEQHKIQHIVDDYKEQHHELYAVQNPTLVFTPDFEDSFDQYYAGLGDTKTVRSHGKWAYFPWRSTLVHILDEKDFQTVRTARNRNLITAEEQDKFYNATVGIGGLSVGSNVAFALALQGGAQHMKLCDMDRLALSNTNRILSGVENLGVLKVVMAARKIYEINPYATIELFPEGLNRDNVEKFFDGLDIVVDELDNLAVKYLIREQAKKNKIAVVMAADNGDNTVVDVERYDLDPGTPFFHGRMGEVDYDMLNSLNKFQIGQMIARHIGVENTTVRTLESFAEMGKTLASWPQLGDAALLGGASVAYCIRKILNGQEVEDNRALVSLDEKLLPNYDHPDEVSKRKEVTDAFKKQFGLE
jgi:hypothetical protein